MSLLEKYVAVVFCACLIMVVSSDVLEAERSSFFGFTHEVAMSSTTLELVDQLQRQVFELGHGDRRVRRYFDAYETPFVGRSRRKMTQS